MNTKTELLIAGKDHWDCTPGEPGSSRLPHANVHSSLYGIGANGNSANATIV